MQATSWLEVSDVQLSDWHNAKWIIAEAWGGASKANRGAGNPFEFGQAVHGESIVDREEELRRLKDGVKNRERLFLIGPRRFGKTSLLNVVQQQLERQGVVVLKYDVEKFESAELLARALLAGAIRALAGPAEKLGAVVNRQLKRFFGALKPEVT